ncbi:hypothetical protein P43SY_000321 [Pythium insidiosum]|uniref:Transmembrane protein n=1 Tax=Pythium insidiosum TaxID=114742 RepID=A0AAD5Q286_PYTIN|nr:hypothetical protein P43SY_000321 [Pythium insidiosum]
MWSAIKARWTQRQPRARADSGEPSDADVVSATLSPSHWRGAPPPLSTDTLSVASNPSIPSSYDSDARRHAQEVISRRYFGTTSPSAGSSGGGIPRSASLDRCGLDRAMSLEQRREDQRTFQDLVHLANTNQPVSLDVFRRRRRPSCTQTAGDAPAHGLVSDDVCDRRLNTHLIEAYIAYARSIGREPDIALRVGDALSDEEEDADVGAYRQSLVQERRTLEEREHWWTRWLGTRYSRRRGCVQFWAFLAMSVLVSVVFAVFIAYIAMDEVLHLDAFTAQNVVLRDDFAYLHIRDEVGFRLVYDIQAAPEQPSGVAPAFQVLLLDDDNFEDYVDGKPFEYVAHASRERTTFASLPLTRVENGDHEDMFLVIQPCSLPWKDPGADFCSLSRLPSRVSSGTKIHKLKTPRPTKRNAAANASALEGFVLQRFSINPMPDDCAASGFKGGAYLLIFLPYVIVSLFGLRVFQMAFHCESFRANLERNYRDEFAVPEAEVDYWQPMPWDRKVPKTRLLGPCCWRKMRRPFEPFYTWWRHENYFTWIFFPYRNERLSRGERAIIIFCSLYVTFYVTFVLALVRDALGDELPLLSSVVVYWAGLTLLPTLAKAVFKEIFKLIFRQRRKFFRLKAAGGDTSGFSFRLAFLAQLLVVVFITLAQGPMLYVWLFRSCTFLREFVYFGVLAAVTRLSLMGLAMDYAWYVIIKTWGWRDLCPYCTERIVHCECFNDDLLVLAVERVGPKWDLIKVLDAVLSRHSQDAPQFELYAPEQLRERWDVLVARAEAHVEKMEKLRACELKRQRDRGRRRSFLERLSFLGDHPQPTTTATTKQDKTDDEDDEDNEEGSTQQQQDGNANAVDCDRERRILALHALIRLDRFERHYDSTIADVFHSLERAVHSLVEKRHRHGRFDTPAQRQARREDEEERRRRAFGLLRGYRVEKTTQPPAATAPSSGDGAAFQAGYEVRLIDRASRRQEEEPSPAAARDRASLPSVASLPRLRRWMSEQAAPTASDSRRERLLSSHRSASIADSENADLIVVVTENPVALERSPSSPSSSSSPLLLPSPLPVPVPLPSASAQSALSRTQSAGSVLQSNTYAVVEREPSAIEAARARVGDFFSWVFKYDSRQF